MSACQHTCSFSLHRRKLLERIESRFNQYKYLKIFDENSLLFMEEIRVWIFIFCSIGRQLRTSSGKNVSKYFREKEVERMKYLAQSPYLNRIENIRGCLK